MGAAAGWHPDPAAPQSGVLRWWDGERWTEHCTGGAARDPLAGPRALDDAAVERLVDGLVADQKRLDRGRLECSDTEWYDPDEIAGDIRSLVDEVARLLPEDEPPLDLLHLPLDRRDDPLLVLTARRLLMLRTPSGGAKEVAVEAAQLEGLTLRKMWTGFAFAPHARGVTFSASSRVLEWINGFLAGPRAQQGRVAEILARPERPPGAPRPDWFRDPTGQFAERFWDGHQWTDDGIGTPPGALALDPPPGPPALDDATVAHLVECFAAAREQTRYRDAYEDGSVETIPVHGHRTAAMFAELQRQFPASDPPLDLCAFAERLVVVSARRLVVLGSVRYLPVVDAEYHERVDVRKAGGAPVVREGDRLTLDLPRTEKRWIEDFLAGPRVLQGNLRALLERPRRAPDAPLPGWYPDPSGKDRKRLWDGTGWTDLVVDQAGHALATFTDPL